MQVARADFARIIKRDVQKYSTKIRSVNSLLGKHIKKYSACFCDGKPHYLLINRNVIASVIIPACGASTVSTTNSRQILTFSHVHLRHSRWRGASPVFRILAWRHDVFPASIPLASIAASRNGAYFLPISRMAFRVRDKDRITRPLRRMVGRQPGAAFARGVDRFEIQSRQWIATLQHFKKYRDS